MLSIFCAPARYVQGRDATSYLGQEIKKLGLSGPLAIIAGKHAYNELASVWKDTFEAEGFKYILIDFGSECSDFEIKRCKKLAAEAGAKTIIGAGGGKVLDTARAVASELELPVVNCPTLASSDAPCSALSVVYTESGAFQEYKFYKRNPDLVLVDTSVIARAPARLLVAGMGDALATWFEADTVRKACKKNQVGGKSTISADALANLCFKTLLADGAAALGAVKMQVVTPALERLVEANTLLSGLGFESGGLAVAHSVHNGLTVLAETHNYYHGEKVAFGLICQLVLEGKSNELINEVLAFCVSVGLPVCFDDLGLCSLSREDCLRVAERATAPGETAHNEPFEVSPENLMDAIFAADAHGRQFRKLKQENDPQFCLSIN